MSISSLSSKKAIDVAVAVLKYAGQNQEKYLLARRHLHQHQGGKLEFVGGKIEQGESVVSALVREVHEELGLDIKHNLVSKLGRICHDYTDKSVCLHVYQVLLSDGQYQQYKDKAIGQDGQAIGFYDKAELWAHKDEFPEANVPIFTWLNLPSVISISHELVFFQNKTDWLDCYAALPQGRALLVRTQSSDQINRELIRELLSKRADLRLIVSMQDMPADTTQVMAIRLTQSQLMALELSTPNLPNLPVIVSCHDEDSIAKANELAKVHDVMAIMLSPVKPTKTHPDEPELGWDGFACLAKKANVPVIALGGLSPDELMEAYQHGAVAIAGIRGFI